MNTSTIEMVEQLQSHAGVMPWLGDAGDMLERQNTRINQLTTAVDEALAAIGSMQVLEAGASYGVRLPLGEIEKVQAILKAAQPGVCEHDWRNRVSGGSKCTKCDLWQNTRITAADQE